MTNYVNPTTRIGGVDQIVVPDRPPVVDVNEAPFDDEQYVRVNGEWVPVDTPEIVYDTVPPNPPAGLSATGTVVTGGDAVNYALTWVAPTTNVDATPLTDFGYYVVRWRYTGSGPYASFVSNAPSAMLHGLVLGANIEWGVLARDTSGNDSTWATANITGLTDTVGPVQPSPPTTSSQRAIITVAWDGLDSAAHAPPPDFDHLEFYMSATTGGPWQFVGRVTGAGAVLIPGAPVGSIRYFSSIAFDTSGNASVRSVEVSDTVLGIVGPDISAGAISANMISSGELSAAITMTGYLLAGNPTGSRVVIDGEGIRQYDDNEDLVVSIPTDSLKASTFEGDIIADSIIIKDYLVVYGLLNRLARGSVLTVESAITAPPGAPKVAVSYPAFYTNRWASGYACVGAHANLDDSNELIGAARYTDDWTGSANTSGMILGRSGKYWTGPTYTDASGTVRTKYSNIGSATAVWVGGAERLVLQSVYTTANGGNPVSRISLLDPSTMNSSGTVEPVRKTGITTANDTSTFSFKLGRVLGPAGGANFCDRIAMGMENWNNQTAQMGKITLRQYVCSDTAITLVAGSQYVIDSPMDPAQVFMGVTHGESVRMGFPGPSQYLWLVHASDYTYAYAAATMARLPEFDFPTIAGASRMFTFGDLATNAFLGFRSVAAADWSPITKYTNNHWDSTVYSNQWWVSSTNWDNNNLGAQHETPQGPRATLVMKKRAGLTVTVPAYQVRPIPPTNDDPLAAKIYIGRGATDPGRANMEYAAQAISPNRTVYVADFVFTGGGALVAPPLASNFPVVGNSAKVVSSDGTAWSLEGDGKATLAAVEFDPAVAPGLKSPAMRIKEFPWTVSALTNIASTTPIVLGTGGGNGVFQAPPSGTVLLTWSGMMKSAAVPAWIASQALLRTGNVIGSGTPVDAGYETSHAAVSYTPTYTYYSKSRLFTGLTPGADYNVQQVAVSGDTTAGGVHVRGIVTVTPSA